MSESRAAKLKSTNAPAASSQIVVRVGPALSKKAPVPVAGGPGAMTGGPAGVGVAEPVTLTVFVEPTGVGEGVGGACVAVAVAVAVDDGVPPAVEVPVADGVPLDVAETVDEALGVAVGLDWVAVAVAVGVGEPGVSITSFVTVALQRNNDPPPFDEPLH